MLDRDAMDSAPQDRRVFRFERFELEPKTDELRKDGRPIKLHPQPLQLLATLLNKPGTILSREEIKDALWADRTHVDFDLGINSCIRQIRYALGDDAENPRFVQTIPRQGYRFIAAVRCESSGKAFPLRRGALTLSLILVVLGTYVIVRQFMGRTESRPIESLLEKMQFP